LRARIAFYSVNGKAAVDHHGPQVRFEPRDELPQVCRLLVERIGIGAGDDVASLDLAHVLPHLTGIGRVVGAGYPSSGHESEGARLAEYQDVLRPCRRAHELEELPALFVGDSVANRSEFEGGIAGAVCDGN
jgi:hypothetical protein